MESAKSYRKISLDMSIVQLTWAFWFSVIVALVYCVLWFFKGSVEVNNQIGQLFMRIAGGIWDDQMIEKTGEGSFYFFQHPSKIFMFICGVISVSSFLTFYVKQGLTRKSYFFGAAVSSVILSIALSAIAFGVYSIEQIIAPINNEGEESMLVNLIVYTLTLLVYYTAGWFINAGFYRFDGGGLLFIVPAVAIIFIVELLWMSDQSMLVKCLTAAFLILAEMWVIRFITRRVRVKLK